MKSIGPEKILSHSEHVVSREIDGTLIIVPLTSGVGDMEDDLFSLNETGTAIWKQLDGRQSLTQVITALGKKYQADPGEIERDVMGIVAELLKRKMLVEAAS